MERLFTWHHSDFNVDNPVRIDADDSVGRQLSARYIDP